MFKNYQEYYQKPCESRLWTDFNRFNPKYDRIKLIASAILIPVACTFFYFFLSGHKYAELGFAVSDIETSQPVSTDGDHTATTVMSERDTLPWQNLLELTGFLIADDTTETLTNSVYEESFVYEESLTGRSQIELIMLNITQQNDGTPMPEIQIVDNSDRKRPGQVMDSENEVSSEITGDVKSARQLPYNQLNMKLLTSYEPEHTADKNSTKHGYNEQLPEQQSKMVLVIKIMDLLESEITATNSTADTSEPIFTTRQTKKSFDVSKLESILEDI